MSRTSNAIKNTKFGIIGRILNLVLSFASRTLFIHMLGSTYLGINGLYSEILSLLSFAELGFGSAMTYAMYGPVAKNEHEKILRLLDFYKKVYRIIAVIIAVLGVSLMPFLQYIVKGADFLCLSELRIYYSIFLFNTVTSYFVTYKLSYLNALQKNYIWTNINTVINVVGVVGQMIVIATTKSYLCYLLINSMVILVSRFVIELYLNRKYPVLKDRPQEPLSKVECVPIITEVKGLIVHQFASVAVHSTDNIIISSLSGLGVIAVGLISNYNMLMNAVLGFVQIIFSSVASGFGNIVATSTPENYNKVFREVNFLSFWIYGFCAICFWILIPPFITLWIGSDNLVDPISFLLIVVNGYLQGQSTTYHYARIAKGNFSKDKWLAFIQALVNLVVSIVGAKMLGLVGVYIGTVISRLVYISSRPRSTYTFLFNKSPKEYYIKMVVYCGAVMVAGYITMLITAGILEEVNVFSFIMAAIICIVVPNTIFLVLFSHTPEFKGWVLRLKALKYN